MPEVTLLNGALYDGKFRAKGTKLTVDNKRAADWAKAGLAEPVEDKSTKGTGKAKES